MQQDLRKMEKITYKCKACNAWEKSINLDWADARPRYCGNAKCKLCPKGKKKFSSFLKEPEMLEIILPTPPPSEPEPVPVPVIMPEPEVKSTYHERSNDKKEFRRKRRG